MNVLPYLISLTLILTMAYPSFGQQKAKKRFIGIKPQLTLSNGQSEGKIRSSDMRSMRGLLIDMGNRPVECQVKSFTVTWKFLEHSQTYKSTSDKFAGATGMLVKKAKPGDIYVIHDVCAVCGPKAKLVQVEGITMTVQ